MLLRVWYHPRKGAKTREAGRHLRRRGYHPRKGARTPLNIRLTLILEYHPRKGAKTGKQGLPNQPLGYHPRRGRKLDYCCSLDRDFSTIPVRGQKTPHQKMRSFSFANLNSLSSMGCPSMNGTIAAAVIFSLLRLLHSYKMCYNKANSKHLLQNQQIRFPFIVQLFHNP